MALIAIGKVPERVDDVRFIHPGFRRTGSAAVVSPRQAGTKADEVVVIRLF